MSLRHYIINFSYLFALNSPTSGGRSVGIVRLRTKITELFVYLNTSILMLYHCVVTYVFLMFRGQSGPKDISVKTRYCF
jgi:hypothetical protein